MDELAAVSAFLAAESVMPFQDVALVPGVSVQQTFEQNQASISISQLVRFKSNQCEKMGGWISFYPTSPLSSAIVRDLHAWQGLTNNKLIADGATDSLRVLQLTPSSAPVLTDISPQVRFSTPTPSFSVSSGSNLVTVVDTGSSANVYSVIRLDTPIFLGSSLGSSLGGQILFGQYQVFSAIDANSYIIVAAQVSPITTSSGGTLPKFYTTAGSAFVDVTFPTNLIVPQTGQPYISAVGLYYPFGYSSQAAFVGGSEFTSVGGLTIVGPYQITSIIDSTHFQIQAANASSTTLGSSQAVSMNSTLAAIEYLITTGPPALGGAYGAGNYGAGQYGIGTPPGPGGGTKTGAANWELDNWGQLLLAVPSNGPTYNWSPIGSLTAGQVIATAPAFSGGGFVSQPQQILVLWGTTTPTGVQDPLFIAWSDQNNFTNFVPTTTNFAGSFRIPTGSVIRGGIQAPLFGVIWTDIDAWMMSYVGQPLVFGFTRVGTGCGLIGQHAAGILAGTVYWASDHNFWQLGQNGVAPIPCSVWNYFFQQLDSTNQGKVVCAVNSAFNEIMWHFPIMSSLGGTGENTNYVKLHSEGSEYEWDYGTMGRTAWVDTTVVGPPMGTDLSANLLQHEMTYNAAGTAMNPFIETGFFVIGDGSDLALIDWVIPDMLWSVFPNLQPGGTSGTVMMTFFTVDYPGAPERKYGPYSVQQSTPYINTRFRGRFMRVRLESNDLGSFWSIGRIKFRYGTSGRR